MSARDRQAAARDAGAAQGPVAPLAPPTTGTDREAMGLPARFVPARCPDHRLLAERWVGTGPDALVAALADEALPLEERIGAATRLDLLGDPRIRPFEPSMCAVPAAAAVVGLAEAAVSDVLARFDGLFLERSWILKECPAHVVELAPYRIGRYPVTNREYAVFLEETGFPELPTAWPFGRFPEHLGNHPVYTVSIEAARAYAAWLAGRTGRRFRLPREAEWEYAAAGPEGREFPWGDAFGADRANTIETGLAITTPVGVFPQGRSPFGADDMAGNVEEYVDDAYAPYPGGEAVRDDLAVAWGDRPYAVARGGSFTRFRDLARTRRRHGLYPRPIYAIGFRLAEDAP
jgi:formylglycine-generating enzyme required for sulfatase activity